MDRDYRLTGAFRGQTDAVEAPLGYEGRLFPVPSGLQGLTCVSQLTMEGKLQPLVIFDARY